MGEQHEHEAEPSEAEEPKAGWLERWRERRRKNSDRAADINRRASEVDRRNRENSAKYGAGR
jgi:hypothetical protein